ncbi:hypothetical protein LTR10_014843 [Elasticomyces elasticus]|uniref:Zn(2)-C6 fungal-type domain-containing protein n=1 Tax=Exophiala sideris TaxID=1016849 RepID=A0ABR0JFT2_9EURO|nr:hypothetical protein LTR10_014843 [Elasticomyces elasticus]KAK5025686.1 hypothetical protein LTS07_007890 [Exophiala sideris]KAK5033105.1 hypothetical protein LTR13_007070 [Exophiala sideris]KAK5063590.1 hypothetical protein LTR69_004296 [Exophiala sideris]KAK5180577.1 hypothetical protein LTR44_006891 [Eurotiomycetes sp. CCFEE 6388]
MSATLDQHRKATNTVQACDSCRRKKRRCDFNAESERCTACDKTDSPCQITHVTKPREKRKRKHMDTLETRLRSLEDLIKSSVAAPKTTPPQSQEQSDITTSAPASMEATNSTSWTADSVPADGTFATTDSQPHDISQYWNNEESPSFQMPSVLDATDIDLRPQVRMKGDRKCSMPPAQGGLFLLQEFLVDFNTAVPLFDVESISTVFLDCYNGRADGLVISWVVVKIVLAIAHRLRAMSPLGVAQDTENVQTYLEESMEAIPGFLLMKPSLLLAQCYLGMAILLSTSSRPQPAARFVSMTLHMLQDLRVNDPPGDNAVRNANELQLQRVFWIAYSMDADISLRAGRLPTLSPRLINVELCAAETDDNKGEICAAEGEFKVNVFRLRAQLALIQAQLMECILEPRTFESEHSQKDVLQALAVGLDQWRENPLFDISIDRFQHLLHRSDLFHIIVLESAYLATAYVVRAHLSLGSNLRSNPFIADGLMAVISTGAISESYDEARRFIGILNLLPGDSVPCNWLTLESVVSALVVLLAHITQNSRTVDATADFGVAKSVLHTVYQLVDFRKDPELTNLQHLCADMYLRTDLVVQQHNASKR